MLTINANKIPFFTTRSHLSLPLFLSFLITFFHIFNFTSYTSHTHVYESNLVRAWSNIYFNSIEEIPYSHCPIKVLKFNIYTKSIAETAYDTDSIVSYRFFLVDINMCVFICRKSNRVHYKPKQAITITIIIIIIIIMTNKISK